MLADAGPLVAIIDRGEASHARCVATLSSIYSPMITSWPAFTEAMYLLGDAGGWTGQAALWSLVEREDLIVEAPREEAERERIRHLMEQYRDLPMDLADASLVAMAESRDLTRVFTLDRHFHIYRIHGRQAFDVLPLEP